MSRLDDPALEVFASGLTTAVITISAFVFGNYKAAALISIGASALILYNVEADKKIPAFLRKYI